MFGRPTIGGATRRSRYRIAILVVAALVVALVIGEVIDQVVDSGSANARHEAASWSAGLQPIVVRSSSTGIELAQLLAASKGTGLLKVEAMLETVTSTSREEQTSFTDLGIAAPSSEAALLATSVFKDRANAMSALGTSVGLATGSSPDAAQATADCTNAASLVSASDAAAGQLVRLLRKMKGATPPPNAQWNQAGTTFAASDCARLLRELASTRGVSQSATLTIVAISVDPNPVRILGVPNPTTTTTLPKRSTGGPSGAIAAYGPSGPIGTSGNGGVVTYIAGPSGQLIPVTTTTTTTTTTPAVTTTTLQIPPAGSRSYLPPTSSITVDVVVVNRGDVKVGPVLVHAQLLGGAGEASPFHNATIASMAPGGSAYLSVGPLSIKKLGTDFTLYVSATTTGLKPAVARVGLAKS